MSYHQITSEERYRLSALRVQGLSNPEIARTMARHRSTIWRELQRNVDGHYHVQKAIQHASARSYATPVARCWPSCATRSPT